jgi:hypothetical protein
MPILLPHRINMVHVVAQPTSGIIEICDLMDQLIGKFLNYRNSPGPTGKYESEVEAINLSNLAVRHADGVLTLARTDLVLLPPALAAARACLEAAVKAAWLVDADNPYEREARWLTHFASEERYLQRTSDRLEKAGQDVTKSREREKMLREFRLSVTAMMPKNIKIPEGNPPFDSMLSSLGGSVLYPLYITLSQFTHAEHNATWIYRKSGIGNRKKIGEFIEPGHWYIPLRACLMSLWTPGHILASRIGSQVRSPFTDQRKDEIESKLDKLNRNSSRLERQKDSPDSRSMVI